jgi:hypothetical protein
VVCSIFGKITFSRKLVLTCRRREDSASRTETLRDFSIIYRAESVIGFFKDFDELYSNVTGNGWTLPIDQAEAIIELPHGARIINYAAYTGYQGDRGKDFSLQSSEHGIIFKTTRGLASREGLTAAVAWFKGLVYP